jgi:TetR/AcrR family transcriptional regulator
MTLSINQLIQLTGYARLVRETSPVRRRRSPSATERKRDAERTRERILDAALVEFGEHGFAGARTGAIAERAGVNQQLIAYYFDGKEGLYRAVGERWPATAAPLRDQRLPLAEVVGNFVRAGAEQRSWARMLVWGELTGAGGGRDGDGYFAEMVEDVRRRQAEGEIAEDLDPAYLLLVLFAAALAPTALPRTTARITGLPPDSPELVAAYGEQLRRILGHLSG